MPRADLTLVLFWTSLGLSAAAVFLFLWLMRKSNGRDDGGTGRAAPRRDE